MASPSLCSSLPFSILRTTRGRRTKESEISSFDMPASLKQPRIPLSLALSPSTQTLSIRTRRHALHSWCHNEANNTKRSCQAKEDQRHAVHEEREDADRARQKKDHRSSGLFIRACISTPETPTRLFEETCLWSTSLPHTH